MDVPGVRTGCTRRREQAEAINCSSSLLEVRIFEKTTLVIAVAAYMELLLLTRAFLFPVFPPSPMNRHHFGILRGATFFSARGRSGAEKERARR